MAQYIDKADVVAEIKKWLHQEPFLKKDYHDAYTFGLESVLKFLDTLEVKEVDLEEEIELVKGDYEQVDVAWNNDFDYIARHFFELGLKAQKGK